MRNVIATKFWTPLLVLALLSGCSKDDDKEVTTVTYKGYSLKVDQTTLSTQQIDILNKVNSEQPIEFSDISEAMIAEHAKSFVERNNLRKTNKREMPEGAEVTETPDAEVLKQALASESKDIATRIHDQLRWNLGAGLSMSADLNDIKMVSEDILVAQNHGQIIYNVEANSPVDLLLNNKMQCYSGTVYAQMVFRSGTRAQFVAKNPVVIYKKNHVLPGYMVQTENGYELVEVETTVSGRGERRTLVKDLYEEMRIIDAEVFALMEIFKTRLAMEDGLKMMNTALLQAAEKYSIPLDQIEPRQVLSVPTDEKGVATKARVFLNTDFMAFGDFSNMPAGDITRGESSRLPIPAKTGNEQFLINAGPAPQEEIPVTLERYNGKPESILLLKASLNHAGVYLGISIKGTDARQIMTELNVGNFKVAQILNSKNAGAIREGFARFGLHNLEIQAVSFCQSILAAEGNGLPPWDTQIIEPVRLALDCAYEDKQDLIEASLTSSRLNLIKGSNVLVGTAESVSFLFNPKRDESILNIVEIVSPKGPTGPERSSDNKSTIREF